MLRSLRDLLEFKVKTPDGWSSPIEDFYLEKEDWIVRHILAEDRRAALRFLRPAPVRTGRRLMISSNIAR
jgi:hypothetical protein